MESLPYAFLPATIITFYRRLESRFVGWYKHWYNTQTQAKATDTSQRVRLSTPLKDSRVIELCIVRQAELCPKRNQVSHCIFRSHLTFRTRECQSAKQRNAVKNLNQLTTFKTEVFDEIKLIEFCKTLSDLW